MAHPIFTEEHDLIRAQLRRFVEDCGESLAEPCHHRGVVILGDRRQRCCEAHARVIEQAIEH